MVGYIISVNLKAKVAEVASGYPLPIISIQDIFWKYETTKKTLGKFKYSVNNIWYVQYHCKCNCKALPHTSRSYGVKYDTGYKIYFIKQLHETIRVLTQTI